MKEAEHSREAEYGAKRRGERGEGSLHVDKNGRHFATVSILEVEVGCTEALPSESRRSPKGEHLWKRDGVRGVGTRSMQSGASLT